MELTQFKPIEGFSKYETDGITVRNKETQKTCSYKTGTKKFQLVKDDGTRPTLFIHQINLLVFGTTAPTLPATEEKRETVQETENTEDTEAVDQDQPDQEKQTPKATSLLPKRKLVNSWL